MNRRFKTLAIFFMIAFKVSAQTPALVLPDFTFYKFDKTLFTEKDLETNKLLFFFFFDADCEHCQQAMKHINEHAQDYKEVAVYLISMDDKEKINQFINTYGSNLSDKKNVTVLQDLKNEFISKFTPRRYPAMFLYSADKKLLDYEDNEESVFRFSRQINLSAKQESKK